MKSLVVYSSQSGNTKKLAEAVLETLDGEKEIFALPEAPDPAGYDLVAVGFWLQAGKPDPGTSAYLEQLGAAKVFLFATHGAAADSAHAKNAMAHAVSVASPAQVVGTFSCQGEVNPKVLEKVQAKTPPPPWIGDAATAAGHPDEADLDRLRQSVAVCLAGI